MYICMFTIVPFVSRFLPSDKFKIWKKNGSLRIDYSLAGMNGIRLIRAPMSMIIQGLNSKNGKVIIVNHELEMYEEHVVSEETNMTINSQNGNDAEDTLAYLQYKLTNPIRCGQFDSKSVTFAKAQKGFIFRQDWIEDVGKSENGDSIHKKCQVYQVKGLEINRKERTEHLSASRITELESSKVKNQSEISKINDNVNVNIDENVDENDIGNINVNVRDIYPSVWPTLPAPDRPDISFEKYFSPDDHENYIHMGRTLRMKEKKFSISNNGAKVWMAPESPISIKDLMPLLQTLMATNEAMEKLSWFIECNLPAGFPVKVEVPFFGVLTVKLEIGHISMDPGVTDDHFKMEPILKKGYKKGTVLLEPQRQQQLSPKSPSKSPKSPSKP